MLCFLLSFITQFDAVTARRGFLSYELIAEPIQPILVINGSIPYNILDLLIELLINTPAHQNFSVRDVLSVIFFTTIGLHVYPLFVWSQITLIILLTLFVVSIKVRVFIVSIMVRVL